MSLLCKARSTSIEALFALHWRSGGGIARRTRGLAGIAMVMGMAFESVVGAQVQRNNAALAK